MFQYTPTENLRLAGGGARNILDGSRGACIEHLQENFRELENGACESNVDNFHTYIKWLKKKLPLNEKFGIVFHDTNRYILKHRSGPDVDTIVINNDEVAYLYSNSGRLVESFAFGGWQNVDSLPELFDLIVDLSDGYRVALDVSDFEDDYFIMGAIDGKANIYAPYEVSDSDHNSNYRLTGEFENVNVVEVSAVQKPNVINPNTGEVKMANQNNKVTAIVTANKTAAQNAAKIEAGTIAINKLAALIAPKMPFGTSSYLKSPLGKVVLANVVNFAVQQYAANNPKAKIIGEAVMDAAALELVQSFNVGAMIDDLIGSVNLTGLVDEPAEGLAKYAVDKSE